MIELIAKEKELVNGGVERLYVQKYSNGTMVDGVKLKGEHYSVCPADAYYNDDTSLSLFEYFVGIVGFGFFTFISFSVTMLACVYFDYNVGNKNNKSFGEILRGYYKSK